MESIRGACVFSIGKQSAVAPDCLCSATKWVYCFLLVFSFSAYYIYHTQQLKLIDTNSEVTLCVSQTMVTISLQPLEEALRPRGGGSVCTHATRTRVNWVPVRSTNTRLPQAAAKPMLSMCFPLDGIWASYTTASRNSSWPTTNRAWSLFSNGTVSQCVRLRGWFCPTDPWPRMRCGYDIEIKKNAESIFVLFLLFFFSSSHFCCFSFLY